MVCEEEDADVITAVVAHRDDALDSDDGADASDEVNFMLSNVDIAVLIESNRLSILNGADIDERCTKQLKCPLIHRDCEA